jgi:cytochrome c553
MIITTPLSAADGTALFGQHLCVTCHGAGGNAPIIGTYPKLAGQNKGYLVAQFKDIQSRVRDNGQTSAMRGIGQGVRTDDIEAIADYWSKL